MLLVFLFVCQVLFFIEFYILLFISDVVMDAGDMVAKEATEAAIDYLENNNGAKVAKLMVEVRLEDSGYETVKKGLN